MVIRSSHQFPEFYSLSLPLEFSEEEKSESRREESGFTQWTQDTPMITDDDDYLKSIQREGRRERENFGLPA